MRQSSQVSYGVKFREMYMILIFTQGLRHMPPTFTAHGANDSVNL